MATTKKSDRQKKYEEYSLAIIKMGIANIFPAKDVRIAEQNLKNIKEKNPNLKVLLGDVNFYAEKFLFCTSKATLKETHSVFTTETRRYWCQSVGIEPRIETNQGKDKRTGKLGEVKKSYNNNCLLTIDQSVDMLCCYLRFKIAQESKTPIKEFHDLGIAVFLDFLAKGKCEILWILEDEPTGKFLVAP